MTDEDSLQRLMGHRCATVRSLGMSKSSDRMPHRGMPTLHAGNIWSRNTVVKKKEKRRNITLLCRYLWLPLHDYSFSFVVKSYDRARVVAVKNDGIRGMQMLSWFYCYTRIYMEFMTQHNGFLRMSVKSVFISGADSLHKRDRQIFEVAKGGNYHKKNLKKKNGLDETTYQQTHAKCNLTLLNTWT